MLESARRLADIDGVPRLTMEEPAPFFTEAEAEIDDPAVWVGELYLELHRGTYTSQAATKLGNRRAEFALRDAELWTLAGPGGRLPRRPSSTSCGSSCSSTSSTTSSPARGSTGSTRTRPATTPAS